MSNEDIQTIHPETSASLSTTQEPLPRTPLEVLRTYAADPSRGNRLSVEERRTLSRILRHAPDAIVDDVCRLAEEHDGVVLGVRVDPIAVRAAIEDGKRRRLVCQKLRDVARRVEDEGLSRKAEAVSQAMKAYRLILQVENDPEGAPYRDAMDELKRARRKAKGTKRRKAVVVSPVTPKG